MPVEARVTKIWKNQKLLLVVLLLGFSAAFLFDGFIRYPRLNAQYRKYLEFANAGDIKGWDAYAQSQGWSTTPPEKEHSELEQFVFAGITGVLGLWALFFWLGHRHRVLRMDENGVHPGCGVAVPFDAITRVDDKKWKSKGIARVHFTHAGRTGSFIVDDYKFETNAARAIHQEIEKRLAARG